MLAQLCASRKAGSNTLLTLTTTQPVNEAGLGVPPDRRGGAVMEPHRVRGCPVTDQSKILAACLDACSMETWTINLDGIRSTLAVVADGLESDQGAALAWLTGDLRPSSTSRSRKPARRSPTACTDSFMRRLSHGENLPLQAAAFGPVPTRRPFLSKPAHLVSGANALRARRGDSPPAGSGWIALPTAMASSSPS